MKRTELYPSLVNWPLLIGGCLIGAFIRLDLGWISSAAIIVPLILFMEWNRVRKVVKEIREEVTPDLIRSYYKKDAANKWMGWKDQVQGINELIKKSP